MPKKKLLKRVNPVVPSVHAVTRQGIAKPSKDQRQQLARILRKERGTHLRESLRHSVKQNRQNWKAVSNAKEFKAFER